MTEPPLMQVGETISYQGWELDEMDNFGSHDHNSLRERYRDQNIWERDVITNNELGYYEKIITERNHIIHRGSHTSLTALPNPDFGGDQDIWGPTRVKQRYTSAMLTTRGQYATTYGRIQSTMKLPKGVGLWPAFWMLPEFDQWPPGVAILKENDIMEFINRRDALDTVHATVHSRQFGTLQANQCTHTCPFDVTVGKHLFGVDWSPRYLKYWIDGLVYHIVPTPTDFHDAFHLLWNLAIGGDWPGNPAIDTPFPSALDVYDWSVYKYTGAAGSNPEPDTPLLNTQDCEERIADLRKNLLLAVDDVFTL